MKPKAEGYQALEKRMYAWMASIAHLYLSASSEANFSYKLLKNIKKRSALFCTALRWRRNKALPHGGSGMGCLPFHPCWSVLGSVSRVLGHSGSVRGTVCLRKRTDKTQLSLRLQGEEENSHLECDGPCFKQVLLATTPVKSAERCWCTQRVHH